MATPRPPPQQRISPQGSPAPPPPPKVDGTEYVWADAGAGTTAAPGSARVVTSQLPVDATQGGIIPGTGHGVRLSLQPDYQQPPNLTNSGRSPASPLPAVTAESLPPAWNTQKATQAQLPGTYEAAEVPAGMRYPEAPKKPGKKKKGKRGVEDDGGGGGVIIPLGPPVGQSAFTFGITSPGGGISSTGGVIPPPSPRLGGGSGLDGNGPGQGGLKPDSTNSGTATPWGASRSGNFTSLNIPPIEIVPHSPPERGLAPNIEGWQTGRTLSQPLPSGDPWTEKLVPSLLPTTASPGRSRAAGGFGAGGWGEPATSSSDVGGGISGMGGVVPARAPNKRKKKREGGGGWGGA
jgi:hypothetical protein